MLRSEVKTEKKKKKGKEVIGCESTAALCCRNYRPTLLETASIQYLIEIQQLQVSIKFELIDKGNGKRVLFSVQQAIAVDTWCQCSVKP